MEFLVHERLDLSIPLSRRWRSFQQRTRSPQSKSKQRKRIVKQLTLPPLKFPSVTKYLSRCMSVSCRVPALDMGVQLETSSPCGDQKDGSVPTWQAAQCVKGFAHWLARPYMYLVVCLISSVCKATTSWRTPWSFGTGAYRTPAPPKPAFLKVGELPQRNKDRSEDLKIVDRQVEAILEPHADIPDEQDSAQAGNQQCDEEGTSVSELDISEPDNSVDQPCDEGCSSVSGIEIIVPDNSVDLPEQVEYTENGDPPSRVTIVIGHTSSSDDLQHSVPSHYSVTPQDAVCTGASVPRPVRLLKPFGIIAFGYQQEVLNSDVQVLAKHLKTDFSYELILEEFKQPGTQREKPFSQEVDNLQMMFATGRAVHRRQVSVSLMIDVSKDVERFVSQMSAPITDSPALGPIPFHNELVHALEDKSVSVFQIDFPSAISEDQTVPTLLLLAKVLTESVVDSGLLGSLECEDQSVILLGNSVFLVSDNHMLDGLVKLFPDQAVGYCIISSTPQKQFSDIVESFLNNIARCFRSKFTNPSYRITELFRQLSPAVVAAEESCEVSSHTTSQLPTPVVPIPRVDGSSLSAECEYSSDNVQIAQACEDTGNGHSEIVGTVSSIGFRLNSPPPTPTADRNLHFLTEDQISQTRWEKCAKYSEKMPCNEPDGEDRSFWSDGELEN